MVCFATGLTGWIHRSGFSVFLILCIVCVGIVGNLIVGVRIYLTTVIVVVVFAGTFRVVLGLVFLSFELTALVSTVTRLFAVVASWFGLFCVLLCALLPHGIYRQLIWSFQPVSSNFFSRCDTICSYVSFFKWLIVFFRWGAILA